MKRFQITLALAVAIMTFSVLFMGMISSPLKEQTAIITHNPEPSAERIAIYNLKKQLIEKIVTDYFNEAKKNGDIVGAGIAIVQGDSILYAKGVGQKRITDDAMIDEHTAFRLGSLSKGFAGIISTVIKEEGLIGWNDNISNYIPNFQLGSNANNTPVTIAHILSHSSGTPYHSYTNLVESGMDLNAIAPKFKSIKPISQPGKQYSYQNAIFALSGSIIEKATQCSFGKTLHTRLFEPLNMANATTNHIDFESRGNFAFPHRKTGNSWTYTKVTGKYDNAIAAGGINASPSDMANWMRFLLGHRPDVLNSTAMQDVFNPQVEIKGKAKYYQRWEGHISSHYGFGWRIHKFEDAKSQKESTMIHHGGSVNNYRNEIALFPDEDLGICVLFNSISPLATHVIPDLHNLIKSTLNDTEQITLHNF